MKPRCLTLTPHWLPSPKPNKSNDQKPPFTCLPSTGPFPPYFHSGISTLSSILGPRMGILDQTKQSIASLKIRHSLTQIINFGMIVTSALMIWKGLVLVTGSESPVVVVLSESMEPGFQRGDILFLRMGEDPVRVGEIIVFQIKGNDIPIVHRVIKVHERSTEEVDILTKGDNNSMDDRALYSRGQLWLHRHHIMGRAIGFLPYAGWVTIILNENPIVKYVLIGTLGLLAITSKE